MPHRENEIIALVTYIHNRVGFRDPPFSFLDFCSEFPRFELEPADMPRGYNGEIIIKGPQKIIRYRTGSKPSTNRFAIGHEIGHGFLHENEDFKCKVSSVFSIFKVPTGNPREWEADFFSSELLAPLPVLNRTVGDLNSLCGTEYKKEINRQTEIFGLSLSIMKSRLEDLNRMREWESEFL